MNNNLSAFEQLPKNVLHQIACYLNTPKYFCDFKLICKKTREIANTILSTKEFCSIILGKEKIHKGWQDWQNFRREKKILYKKFLEHWNKSREEGGMGGNILVINRKNLIDISQNIELARTLASQSKKDKNHDLQIKKANGLFINISFCLASKGYTKAAYIQLKDEFINKELKEHVVTWDEKKLQKDNFIDLSTGIASAFSEAMELYAKRMNF